MDRGGLVMLQSRRRTRKLPRGWIVIIILGAAAIWLTWMNAGGEQLLSSSSEGSGAAETVKRFYQAEQAGDFGSAWELFHPLMQERFDKASYIQKRAHIMMQDFGSKTFEFEVEEPQPVTGWKMDSDAAEIPRVYKVVVKQAFRSPYGNFELVQPCYVTQESGEWRLLWSYETEPDSPK